MKYCLIHEILGCTYAHWQLGAFHISIYKISDYYSLDTCEIILMVMSKCGKGKPMLLPWVYAPLIAISLFSILK